MIALPRFLSSDPKRGPHRPRSPAFSVPTSEDKVATKPKRLQPAKDTVRELYLRSGNLCAFPDCPERILDIGGDLIGEICHIEAAETKGERFNPAMTNEDRRAPANLMLLCQKHHTKTNDVAAYSLDALQRMKAVHEAKFSGAIDKLRAAFIDQTQDTTAVNARTLMRMNDVLRWGYAPLQLQESCIELSSFATTLAMIPLSTRGLLAIIIARAEDSAGTLRTPADELIEAVGGDEAAVTKHVRILERRGVVDIEAGDDYSWIVMRDLASGWPIWADLKLFATLTNTDLHVFTHNLHFNILD
jgi:hypothetical protein